jgi:hypothetical protein
MMKTIATMFVLGGAVLGCSAVAPDVTAPTSDVVRASLDRNEGPEDFRNPVVASIVGAASYSEPQMRIPESYTAVATKRADGTVEGHVSLVLFAENTVSISGNVACFGIAGQKANVAMRVTKTTTPDVPIGSYLVWSFVDGESGRFKSADLNSGFQTASAEDALYHCAMGKGVGAYSPIRGTVEIQRR